MRLHSLSLTAFGPFSGTAVVDFDRLTDAGLFLLSGPTGAGKTSILDGVSFALYGSVPGARHGSRSLRSDHAPADVAPQVVLEATIRGRRLRITRSPAWERPKKRGTGTLLEQAHVLVEELVPARGGAWTTLSTRLDEAADLLRDLLGLSAAQFCQVVLLPQGQFADFLRADADRRRALLETLFDTGRFADVESWLVARRQEAGRRLAEIDGELSAVVARTLQAADLGFESDLSSVGEGDGEDLGPSDLAEAGHWVSRLAVGAAAELDLANAEKEEAVAAAEEARRDLAEARRLAGAQQRAGQLRQRLATLEEQRAAHERFVAELAAARRVAPLQALLDDVQRAQGEVRVAEAALSVAQSQASAHLASSSAVAVALVATGTDGASSSGSAAGGVVAAARSTRDEVVALRDMAARESESLRLSREADELVQRSVELAARRGELARWLTSADEVRGRLVVARATAQAAQTRHALAAAEHARCVTRVAAARRRDELVAEVTAAEDARRQAADDHQNARDAEQLLRERRLAGMAAELARMLAPEAACPVCGNTEHPEPATGTAAVDPAEETAAAQASRVAEAARYAAEQHVAALRVELAAQRSAAGGEDPLEQLERRMNQAARAVRLEGDAAAALEDTDRQLESFDRERETNLREQVALDEKLRGLAAQTESHRLRAEALAAEVADARGDDVSVAVRMERLTDAAGRLDELAACLTALDQATASRRRAGDRLSGAITEHGLRSADDIEPRVRTAVEMRALEEACETFTAELGALTSQLAEPDLVAALTCPAIELGPIEIAFAERDAARVTATSRAAAAADRAAAIQRLAELAQQLVSRRAPLASNYAVADGLARLAEGKSGDNRLRMSLSAYVLAARLEQVAIAATERLLRMTSGRYSLTHSVAAGSGRARGGLSLRVLDAWTGQERDPASLSGGESFAASLSLALGLADVVAAEAGGILLETLFVDEGFGSLDEETLDDVMGVLDGLREGGRAVGIVSHVADLQQRIPVQLRVSKTRSGSTVSC